MISVLNCVVLTLEAAMGPNPIALSGQLLKGSHDASDVLCHRRSRLYQCISSFGVLRSHEAV